MSDPTHSSGEAASPILRDTERRRVGFYTTMTALERAAARPASGREREWTANVVTALADVEAKIVEHVESTERPDGLLDEIVEIAPRLGHKVQLLRDEHPAMHADTVALRERLTTAPATDDGGVADARDEIQRLLGLLHKHRQRGADLLWEAYNFDIGGEH
jgi:hypothetical protein